MITVVALKFFHYLSLFLAGGLGVANAMLFKNHKKAGIPPSPPVQKSMMTLARLGLLAIIFLWVTGVHLTYEVYGTFDLGWAFRLKLLGATVLLGTIAFLNLHLTSQARSGNLPSPTVVQIIQTLARASLVIVLLGVAILTTSA